MKVKRDVYCKNRLQSSFELQDREFPFQISVINRNDELRDLKMYTQVNTCMMYIIIISYLFVIILFRGEKVQSTNLSLTTEKKPSFILLLKIGNIYTCKYFSFTSVSFYFIKYHISFDNTIPNTGLNVSWECCFIELKTQEYQRMGIPFARNNIIYKEESMESIIIHRK